MSKATLHTTAFKSDVVYQHRLLKFDTSRLSAFQSSHSKCTLLMQFTEETKVFKDPKTIIYIFFGKRKVWKKSPLIDYKAA